jgi:hypothetical protein
MLNNYSQIMEQYNNLTSNNNDDDDVDDGSGNGQYQALNSSSLNIVSKKKPSTPIPIVVLPHSSTKNTLTWGSLDTNKYKYINFTNGTILLDENANINLGENILILSVFQFALIIILFVFLCASSCHKYENYKKSGSSTTV